MKRERSLRKVEMTSMIDMIFLLLIFFLVTMVTQLGKADGTDPGGSIDGNGVPFSLNEPPFTQHGFLNDTLRGLCFFIEQTEPGEFALTLMDEQCPDPKNVASFRDEIDKLLATPGSIVPDSDLARYHFYSEILFPAKSVYYEEPNHKKFYNDYQVALDTLKARCEWYVGKRVAAQKYSQIPLSEFQFLLNAHKDFYVKFLNDMNAFLDQLAPNGVGKPCMIEIAAVSK